MADYNESQIAGTKWTRCWAVNVHNPLEGIKQIVFQEEDAVQLGGEVLLSRKGRSCTAMLTADSATKEIDLLNPETGEKIGTTTYQEVYVVLHSAYMAVAQARDAAALEPEPTLPPAPEPAPAPAPAPEPAPEPAPPPDPEPAPEPAPSPEPAP